MEQSAETSDLRGETLESGKRARLTKALIPTFVKYRLSNYAYAIKAIPVTGEDEEFYYQNKNRIKKINQFEQYFDSWEEARAAMLARAEKTLERLKKEIKAVEKKIPKIKEMVKP